MKRLFAILFTLLIISAGLVYAQEQSSPGADTPAAAPTVGDSTSTADSTAEQPTEKPIIKKEKARTVYGLTLGIFTPVDSTVRDTFGDNWIRYGVRPIPTELPNSWRPGFDISFYSMSNGPDEVTIIPLTGGFIRRFGKTDEESKKKTQSYLAINVGPYYCDLNSPTLGKTKTGWGLNGNATYGIVFNNRWSLEARYEAMSKFEDVDFSAFSISASFKLFTARL
ncbi:MAG: porin family protein [Armatimonadetes bacterium]|nr:porin family protein [Armatimonadota bacterium]